MININVESITNRDDLQNLNEVFSLQGQVKEIHLQDKLGKLNFHEDMKKLFEPVSKPIKDVSQDITNTMIQTSKKNNKALEKLQRKLLERMIDRGISAS